MTLKIFLNYEDFLPFIYLFSGSIGVWMQGLELARQALYPLSHTSNPFLLWLFWRQGVVLCPGWPGPWSFCFMLPAVAGIIGVHTPTSFLLRWGVSQTFCLGWPTAMMFPISAFWVARIIGMSYLYPVSIYLFLLVRWGLDSWFHTCKAGTLQLETHLQPMMVLGMLGFELKT
jgi:hypothetical protein